MTDVVRLNGLNAFQFRLRLERESIYRRILFRRHFFLLRNSKSIPSSIRALHDQWIPGSQTETAKLAASNDISRFLKQHDEALLEHDLDLCWSLLCKVREFVEHRSSSVDHNMDWLLGSILGQRPKMFIKKCVESGRYDLVFLHIKVFPQTARSFSFLLSISLKTGDYQQVLELVEIRRQIGLEPDSYSYNAHISALGKLGRLEAARMVFEQAVGNRCDSIYVYNTMLDAYARSGVLEQAQEVWNGISRAGLEPDAVSYVGIMRAWSLQKNIDKVLGYFQEMINHEIQPAPHAFTIVLDCITKTEHPIGGAWLEEFVQSMEESGVVMNKHILSAMLNAFSRQKLDSEQIQFVFQTVVKFRQKSKLGNAVYGSWIDFCTRSGIAETVLEVWKAYKRDNHTPNSQIYTRLLKACCLMKPTDKVHQLVEELTEIMKSDLKKLEKKLDSEDKLRPGFNSLLKFYGGLKDADKVWQFYHFMLEQGPRPNLITFNTVMAALNGCNLFDKTQQVLEKIKEMDLDLDTTSYGILLNACSTNHDLDRARELWSEMKQSNLSPTVECYTSLIDTCIEGGSISSIQSAFEYFSEMKRNHLKPTAVTYGCMLHAFKAKGDVHGAFALYQEACSVGVSPSDECHDILIKMCTEAGQLEEGLDLMKVLVKNHRSIVEETMNSMIRALSTKYLARSLVLLRLMHNRQLEPSSKTYSCLLIACCRESEIRKAFALYVEMISKRIPIHREVGSALIENLSIAGEIQMALRVTNLMFENAGLQSIDTSSIRKGLVINKAPATRRKEFIVYSSIPSAISLGYLAAVIARRDSLNTSMYIFRQIYEIEGVNGMMTLTGQVPQVFEALIERCCRVRRLGWAIEVYQHWKSAIQSLVAEGKSLGSSNRISLATLAFLQASCKQEAEYEKYVNELCQTMQMQRLHSKSPHSGRQFNRGSKRDKAFIEIWGEASTFEELRESIENCPEDLKTPFYSEALSFKVIVDGWGCKLSQEEKVASIEKLDYLPLKGKINLKEPDVVYWLIIADPRTMTGFPGVPYRLYFGRQISVSERSIIERFALRDRPYLGPTSMDTEMSFVMCNHAKVKQGSLVMDPFVGTGSILVAASYHGALSFGCDIDVKILKQTKLNKRKEQCTIFDNFTYYNVPQPTTLFISDIYRSPFRAALEMFDAVICDPPYGVRAGRRKPTDSAQGQGSNTVGHMCKTLIDFSAQLLRTGGRLVFFCPNVHGTSLLDEIPRHPMMELVFCCEQYLSIKYSRCLITMEKILDYNVEAVRQLNDSIGAPVMSIDDIHSIVFSKSKSNSAIPKFRCKQL
eukprot:g1156.t1